MQLDQFDYHLPEELIAQAPLNERSASRLLHFHTGANVFHDRQFSNIENLLRPGDLLVLNDTQVIPARLFGQKSTGGKFEFLLERMLDSHTVLAQIKASKSPKPGAELLFANQEKALVEKRQGDFYKLKFDANTNVENLLMKHGQMPLPPYIQREPKESDTQRYQTVYAKHKGAVAAPTAGLHFDQNMLDLLQSKQITIVKITLHVGAGTFQPVREENILQHQIHAERVIVSEEVCEQIHASKQRGGRVIAVGTTTVRALESAAINGSLEYFDGESKLFITPGFNFNVIDCMITNFHLPKSTLLMLVSAFAGYDTTMAAYRHAVSQKYRFYSYGDAMFIERND
ncbi:MAG: tRNA preQ1(34) S-adenosylmethionine ribosyltransferase-isomerase QueA [Pseudomonadota bacterium]